MGLFWKGIKTLSYNRRNTADQIHTDAVAEMILSICKRVQSIMTVTHIGTEKYHKVIEA